VYVSGRVETESGGTRRRTGGEVKGKEANGVGSQQSSAWLGTVHPVLLQSFSPNPHSKKASTWLNWHPRRYKWTRPFRWKTEYGFCACAITFNFHSNKNLEREIINVLMVLHNADNVRTRWFKYNRDYLCVNLATSVPIIFEPPCILSTPLRVVWSTSAGKVSSKQCFLSRAQRMFYCEYIMQLCMNGWRCSRTKFTFLYHCIV